MYFKQTIIYLFLLFSFHVQAQTNNFEISGKVIESETKKVIELANLALYKADGKTLQTGLQANNEGNFIFKNIEKGKYILQITFIGFEKKEITLDVNKNVNLGSILLLSSSKTLAQVNIVAEKDVIKKEAGKTTVNIAKSSINSTGTLEDVMRNLPNISLDQKSNVTIAGKKSVTIWLDGRPSTMAETNVAAFLKSIPASSIDNIEIITNPSAKYDAEGSGGIIHIHLKKDKRDGLNGMVSAGYGFLYRCNTNASLNFRKGKWNLFGSYGYNRSYHAHIYNEDRKITLPDSIYKYNMHNTGNDKSQSHVAKIGIDFFANDNTSITFNSNFNFSSSHGVGTTDSKGLTPNDAIFLHLITGNLSQSKSPTVTNDISVKSKIDTFGKEISASISHTFVQTNSTNFLDTKGYDLQNQEINSQAISRKNITPNTIHNLIAQLDFSEPTPFKATMEAGLKNESTSNKNNFNLFDKKNGSYIKNNLLSNNFNYFENIFAFYTILNGPIKKWLSYNAGVRMEHTFINSNSNSVNRNYVSFFPNLGLTAQANKEQSVGITYSRRIQRPDFSMLNNAVWYSDPYSTWQGNPNLRPSFSDVVSANYTIMKKKYMLSLDIDGTVQKDLFSEGTKLDSTGISRSGYYNGGKYYQAGLTLFCKFNFTKWWEWQISQSVNYQDFKSRAGINNGEIKGAQYNLWMSTSFKFWKKTSFEINGWMNTGGVSSQGRGFPSGQLNMGLKKSFLKDKLTVNISGQNLLNTMNFRWLINNGGLHTYGKWQVLNRTVYVTLTYNFGSSKFQKREDKGIDSRLKGSGGR